MQDMDPGTNGSAFILPHYSHPQQANNHHCIPSNQQLYEQEMVSFAHTHPSAENFTREIPI